MNILPKLSKAVCIIGDLGQAENLIQNFGVMIFEDADVIVVGKLDEAEERQEEMLNLAWNEKKVYILDGGF